MRLPNFLYYYEFDYYPTINRKKQTLFQEDQEVDIESGVIAKNRVVKIYIIKISGEVVYIGESTRGIKGRLATGSRADNWPWTTNLEHVKLYLFVFKKTDRNWGKSLEARLLGKYFKEFDKWPEYTSQLSPRPAISDDAYIKECADIIADFIF